MNPFTRAASVLTRHRLLWFQETLLLLAAAAHVPLWLWLPVSSYLWLALHVVLPITSTALLWIAWRWAKRELSPNQPVSLLGLAGAIPAAAFVVWGLLSIVPVFPTVEMQTVSFVMRALLAATLATALVLLPFAAGQETAP